MNAFYEWLYIHYATPRLSTACLSQVYRGQMQEWQTVEEKLSRHDRLLAHDLMNTLKNDWGILSFACGVQTGLLLAAELHKEAGL